MSDLNFPRLLLSYCTMFIISSDLLLLIMIAPRFGNAQNSDRRVKEYHDAALTPTFIMFSNNGREV